MNSDLRVIAAVSRPKTVSTRWKIIVDAKAPALARVRAADRILERAKQGVENEEIEIQVAALEQTARQRP